MNVAEVILAAGFAVFFGGVGIGMLYTMIIEVKNDRDKRR